MYSNREYVPTFQQNMASLTSLKEELLRLHYIYSPESTNYHQLSIIDNLRSQVKTSQSQIIAIQSTIKQQNKQIGGQLQTLKQEKEELEDVNMKLVTANEKLVSQLQNMNKRIESMEEDLEREHQLRVQTENKAKRQIQNLKLMHSQELFLLKRKQKKNH